MYYCYACEIDCAGGICEQCGRETDEKETSHD